MKSGGFYLDAAGPFLLLFPNPRKDGIPRIDRSLESILENTIRSKPTQFQVFVRKGLPRLLKIFDIFLVLARGIERSAGSPDLLLLDGSFLNLRRNRRWVTTREINS